jgi:hypothetical protein
MKHIIPYLSVKNIACVAVKFKKTSKEEKAQVTYVRKMWFKIYILYAK